MADEHTYTVPLRKAFNKTARHTRTNKAVKAVRAYLERHLHSDDIKLGQHLNDFLWAKGIRNPPPRVTITAVKDDEGVIRAELVGKEFSSAVQPQEVQEVAQGLKGKLQAAMGKDEKPEQKDAPDEKKA